MSHIRQTYTFAHLEVSRDAFEEIHRLLTKAGYQHAFVDDAIDMQGIGLVARAEPNCIHGESIAGLCNGCADAFGPTTRRLPDVHITDRLIEVTP